jgi:hypothetical protein
MLTLMSQLISSTILYKVLESVGSGEEIDFFEQLGYVKNYLSNDVTRPIIL